MKNNKENYWIKDLQKTDEIFYGGKKYPNRNYRKNKMKKSYQGELKGWYDTQCMKIAGVVGTGIHLYSSAINNDHFQGIYQDLTEGQYFKGSLKVIVPLLLPYCVSLYARNKAKKEVQGKINELEEKICELEKI